MRRQLHIITAAIALAGCLSALCRADDYDYAVAIAKAETTVSVTAKVADPAPSSGGNSMPAAHVKSDAAVAPVLSIKAARKPRESRAPSGPHWTHPMADTKAELITHLLSDGVHRGRHTRAELAAMSYGQLEAIHDADHNASRRAVTQSNCPDGNCPNTTMQRRGLLGRWR